jgi:hypothetical protein
MRHLLFSACVLGCITLPASAGVVYETINKDLSSGGHETVSVMRVQEGKMRMENNHPEHRSVMIFKNDAMHALDVGDKSYTVIDRAAIKQMADQINPALKQMEEQLKNMPPEQRAMVEKMMKQNMPGAGETSAPAEIVKTGRKGSFAGQSCTYVEMRRGGAVEQELCVAPPSALTGGQEMFAVTRQMGKLVEDMLSAIDSPWIRQAVNNQMEVYARLDGFPVFGRYFVNGKPAMETTLKSMRTENMPAAQFEIPADYKRRDLMQAAR